MLCDIYAIEDDEAPKPFSLAGAKIAVCQSPVWEAADPATRTALAQGVLRKLPADVVEMYLRPFVPLDRRRVAAFYPGQITAASEYMAEVEAGLGRIADRKALIFWRLRDGGFPRADLERFERAFPSHRTIELPDASHFFFEDAAPRMIEEIAAFMSEDCVTRSVRWQ